MSNIYGNQIIPNDISSLYFFDKTYDNDELSEENSRKSYAEEDGVLIGRYVLSRTVDTSGNSLTINKVFRKVATSEGVDYEQVAILDAVTPTFHTKTVNINEELFDVNNTTYQYYFDDKPVIRFNDVTNLSTGVHNFKVVITYNGQTKIESVDKYYAATN